MLAFAVGVVLLVSVGLTPWVELLFPAWVLLLSIDIMRTGLPSSRAGRRGDRRTRTTEPAAGSSTSRGVSLARSWQAWTPSQAWPGNPLPPANPVVR